MKKITAILVLALVSSFASAEVISLDVTMTTAGGFDIYTFEFTSDVGNQVSVFQGAFTGSFNQVLAFGAVPTPNMEWDSNPAVDLTYDTHFDWVDADEGLGGSLEDASTLFSSPDGDVATSIVGLIVGAGNIDGQLVVAQGSPAPWVTANVATVEGDYMFDQAVPEPMTMSILAIGGIGVLVRRRRRR